MLIQQCEAVAPHPAAPVQDCITDQKNLSKWDNCSGFGHKRDKCPSVGGKEKRYWQWSSHPREATSTPNQGFYDQNEL
ncbi:unnamed protein product [Ectocarpus sp. CCAP 1310/34]|nr:unnamed protein product [Ectocarpus sp. CCAP 1310/34]